MKQRKEHTTSLKSIKQTAMNRQIGIIGTTARVILGTWLAGSVLYGHMVIGPVRPLPWIIGLVIFPAIFLTWKWVRARHNPTKLKANGPIASVINIIIFFYFLLWTPSSISFMRDAVLVFYGISMLVAAIRGYAGCESLAISNWILKRDDQLGCLFFSPIDFAERKLIHRQAPSSAQEFENDR
jgi:hypothetical protein